MRATCLALLVASALAAPNLAHAGGPVVVDKVATTIAQGEQRAVGWKATQRSLKGLLGDRRLRKALKLRGERIVLGTREGSYDAGRTVAEVLSPLGMANVRVSTTAKGKWRQEIALQRDGLLIKTTHSFAEPKDESIKAAREYVHAQMKGATSLDFMNHAQQTLLGMPKINVEHGEFGPYKTTDVSRVGRTLFTRQLKLDAADWQHLTPEAIATKVAAWKAEP